MFNHVKMVGKKPMAVVPLGQAKNVERGMLAKQWSSILTYPLVTF